MSANILIIEDDPAMQSFLVTLCESAGMSARVVDSVDAGLKALQTDMTDICLLDLGLPGRSGHEFISAARTLSKVAIIVISARNTDFDKITALDAGADDYVPKPFSSGELLARIRVALRNGTREVTTPEEILRAQHVCVNLSSRQVCVGAEEVLVHLTPTEFNLLILLMKHSNKVLTYRMIGQAIWGNAYSGSSEKIRVHIAQLRQKIELNPSSPTIVINEPGVGYRLVA